MRRVYIAHPLTAPTRADLETNLAEAKAYVAWFAQLGVCPVATWIPLAEGLLAGGLETPDLRELAVACNLEVLEACDTLAVCGPRVSAGMELEIEAAKLGYLELLHVEARNDETAARVRAWLEEWSAE